jgi:hypothetical protein
MGEQFVWVVIFASIVGCNSTPLGGKGGAGDRTANAPPSAAAIGSKARVPAGEAHLGFAGGSVRTDAKLNAFEISKLPVTESQLAECRAAGACGTRATSCTSAEPSPNEPALCVEPDNAREFCAWVGGRLPRLAEWLVAARGTEVRRFAWGDASPTCQQHPRGMQKHALAPDATKKAAKLDDLALMAEKGRAVAGAPAGAEVELPCAEAPTPASYRVGARPLSASPMGMQDVLLVPAELIDADGDALLPACQTGACLVYGLAPSAIDSVRPYSRVQHLPGDEDTWSTTPPDSAHALRCVWEVES